jgi:CRP-like cAMP-binding protein
MVPISYTNEFFKGLSPELRAAFDNISLERKADAGEVVLRAGGQCSHLYQLRAGRVECRLGDGHGSVTVAATLGKDDWIGLPEVFSSLPSLGDVITLTPVTLRIIKNHDFEALLERHPALSRRLLQFFSVSLSSIYHQARDRNIMPLRGRLLRMLYMLSFSHGKTLRDQQGVIIKMTQEELSQRLAAARQTLNRHLKRLEQEGLIQVNYGSIAILRLSHLAKCQLLSDFDAPLHAENPP